MIALEEDYRQALFEMQAHQLVTARLIDELGYVPEIEALPQS